MTDANIQVVLLCAGRSRRLGGPIAKPWIELAGKTVMRHALDTFRQHPAISGGVVVVSDDATEDAKRWLADTGWQVTAGGQERSHSVHNGLDCLAGGSPDIVLIHDAARPFVPVEVIDRLLAAIHDGADAAIPTLPPADSLKRIADGTVVERIPRDGIERVQTPQAFRFSLIHDLHRQNTNAEATDDSSLVEDSGGKVLAVAGDPVMAKITTLPDLALAERIAFSMSLSASATMMEPRMATGFDVHRFSTAPGPIMLGGVAIDHAFGFDAHSDGDVALHALTDAVYGLMADGDIGSHFPPSDDTWKDQDSAFFLEQAAAQLASHGARITLADITIIAEAPKITPHRAAIRQRIAEILTLPVSRVSVKATTSEGLGFTGRGEGIAVQAAVTAQFPMETE